MMRRFFLFSSTLIPTDFQFFYKLFFPQRTVEMYDRKRMNYGLMQTKNVLTNRN